MSKKILTVVVPAYNVEAYLDEGLRSFVHPDIMDDLEVLIVNDGSSDRTEAIGKRYEEAYPATFRVITKENGGHGSTINRGIEEAAGQYFKVVDGDDWVDTTNFCRLIKMLKRVDVDVLGSNYTMIDHTTRKPARLQEQPFENLEYGRVYRLEEIVGKTSVPMHAMTIKTEILRKMNMKMDEHMFYVDMEYITFPIPYVNTFLFFEPSVYRYRLGLPNQSMSIKKMQSNLKNHLHVLLRLEHYVEKMDGKLTEAQRDYMNDILGWMIGSQMKIYISFPLGSGMRKEAIKLDRFMKRRNPGAWKRVKNKAVWLLRYSDFLLFPAAVLAFKHRRNSY
ncbi:glycosyltransferase family 2 protein [Frisingicoccus sp.]|uniref:glycosyltransferase family 2 protein n=1 Tax=Frisingicoccus sp. TaxID=1918627 RepID=UPI002EA2206C|nr:glycosyltransferase family A protein [Frisingicoccus sp.]